MRGWLTLKEKQKWINRLMGDPKILIALGFFCFFSSSACHQEGRGQKAETCTCTQTPHKTSSFSPLKHILNLNEVTACNIFPIKPLLPFGPGEKGTKQPYAIKGHGTARYQVTALPLNTWRGSVGFACWHKEDLKEKIITVYQQVNAKLWTSIPLNILWYQAVETQCKSMLIGRCRCKRRTNMQP